MQRQADRGGGRSNAGQHFPFMALCEQRFDDQEISEPEAAVGRAISELKLARKIESGQSAAVGVSSRGIHQLERIVFCLCRELEGMGLKPFIVPAMGSHGGARPKGKRKSWPPWASLKNESGLRYVPAWKPFTWKIPKTVCRFSWTPWPIRQTTP